MGAEEFDDNPRLSLPSDVWPMVHLWRMYRGGMGQGFLPDPGGSLDQSIFMIACFHIMSSADADYDAAEKASD